MTPKFDQLTSLAISQFWQVTVVALVIGMLVWLFCRRRPHLAYVLWLLVVIKCLTPPVWSSPTGLFSWMGVHTAATGPVDDDPALMPLLEGQMAAEEDRLAAQSVAATASELSPTNKGVSTAIVLGIVWLAGCLVFAGIWFGKWIACVLVLRRCSTPADAGLAALVSELSLRLGVRRKVRVLLVSRPIGPAVYGSLRPTILLPRLLLEDKPRKQIEPILAHELAHVRRGDPAMGLLQLVAQALWWFHPLIWWANRQLCRERERLCDEEAVAALACQPDLYAQSLLDVVKLRRRLRPVFGVPGVRPYEITKRRLENIMNRTNDFHRRMPRPYWLILAAGVLLLVPGSGLVLEASSPQKDETNTAAVLSDTSSGQDATAKEQETEAVAALKKLGARIGLDENGNVIRVGLAKNTRVTDADLRHLKALIKLESLQLLDAQITDDGLQHLKDLTKLKALRLGNTQISDAGLVHLKRLTNLQTLFLHGTQISDAGLIHLKNLQKLQDLGIRTTQITDAGLVHLKVFPKLRSLTLPFTQITDAGFEHLKGFPSLENLCLSGDQFTEVGVKHLKKLAKLQSLVLSGDKISDDTVAHLKELPKLESLTLMYTQVSNVGLVHLKGLPNLKSLLIWNAEVSDAGLEHLNALTNLQKLTLVLTKVTDAGVNKLKQALPDCMIHNTPTLPLQLSEGDSQTG